MERDEARTDDATPPKEGAGEIATRPSPLETIKQQIEEEQDLIHRETETLENVRENLDKQQELLQEARKRLPEEGGA